MHKISSIHLFILDILQILDSHDINPMPNFDHEHLKITKVIFSFIEFVSPSKNWFNLSIHS